MGVEIDLLLAVVPSETIESKYLDYNYDTISDSDLDEVTARTLYSYHST